MQPGLEELVMLVPEAEEPAEGAPAGEAAVEDTGPNPIAPEVKELAWGAGAFIVLALAMRFFLFPRVKQGMDARYGKIRGDLEGADAAKAAAERDVAEYQAALAEARAEAAGRVEAARATLEAERQARLAEVNARVGERRAAAAAAADEAKRAARSQVESAAGDVAAAVAEAAIGRRPGADAVARAVSGVTVVAR
jgi:F-type H+-transporting ATPase subunit b